ncbi:MAG: phage terminase large subunit [Alphaproteobacteria bacterium]
MYAVVGDNRRPAQKNAEKGRKNGSQPAADEKNPEKGGLKSRRKGKYRVSLLFLIAGKPCTDIQKTPGKSGVFQTGALRAIRTPDPQLYEDRIDNVKTGSRFIFKGLRDQNSQNIKSLEGVDYCWIEEGQTITRKSWDILNPTIRKDGSEIWISMNREEETDALWVALAANPDERTLVRKVNYYDNPFCPQELKLQAEKCKREDYESYLHVWEGDPLPQGTLKLISSADVHRALAFKIDNANNMLPLVVGVDVARFGDDRTAICRRRGRQAYKMQTYKHLDTVAVANLIVRIIREEKPVRVNIDAGQNGAGVIDLLIDRGYQEVVREVNFGSKAQDTERYANRRAEMWGRLNDWLKTESGVSLTDMPGILEDLTAVNKGFDNRGRLMLEEKRIIKTRLGFSPDLGDALALTFAEAFYPSSLQTVQTEFVDGNVYVDDVAGGFVDGNIYI